jgi:FKBP-type peptidyl-prolyl cis-trans isomerase FklB
VASLPYWSTFTIFAGLNAYQQMKKTILFTVSLFATTVLMAQAKKPATTAKKPAPATTTQAVMKNAVDSFSYAIGLSIANFYKAQGVKDINNQLVLKAITDVKNNKSVMNDSVANSCIVTHIENARNPNAAKDRARIAENKKLGAAFLAENKQKPGIVTLPSGLQYMVLQEGTGPKPTLADRVKAHYTGSLTNGTVFESSYTNNQPITIGVGEVIRGWTEALQMMGTGSKWRLFIPSDMAYGDRESGAIPGGSVLIFDVELLEIVK